MAGGRRDRLPKGATGKDGYQAQRCTRLRYIRAAPMADTREVHELPLQQRGDSGTQALMGVATQRCVAVPAPKGAVSR